jgi:hypothetical protein
LLLLFGLHRGFFALLRAVGVPDLGISALTGITNLSWYEIAYVLGGAFKNVFLFTLLPYLGCATGLMGVGFQFTSVRWRYAALRLYIAFALLIALACLMILLWRSWRGFGDPWRLITAGAFLLWYVAWGYAFRPRRTQSA